MAIGVIFGFLGCRASGHFTTPVETVQTLESAVTAKDYKLASACFSDEMRRENASAIETRAFYLTDHWIGTVTTQNFLKPIPILSKSAELKLTQLEPETATVQIVYPDPVDKDIRLRMVTLKRATDGTWRVSELFGRLRGRSAVGKAR